MKTYLILILATFSITSYSQDSIKLIKKIRREVQNINTSKNYKIVNVDNTKLNFPDTDGGIEIVGYLKFDPVENTEKVYKIIEWVGLSYGNIITEYYLQAEKLIFVYQREQRFPYNDSIGVLRIDTTILGNEGRFYFRSEKLKYKIQNNKFPYFKTSSKNSTEQTFVVMKNNLLKNIPRGNLFYKKR